MKCCCLGASSVYTIQSCTNLKCHFIQSHIGTVYVCLAVTCHLHFWQNDRDLLHAAVVTRGWNGYWNKSQHRKLTPEKKILLLLLPGLEPGTFRSWAWRSNHWAIPALQWIRKVGLNRLCYADLPALKCVYSSIHLSINNNNIYLKKKGFLECPSTTPGGSTGRFTITLTTHIHTHASDGGIGTAVKKFRKLLNRCFLRVALKKEAESEWHIIACLRQIVPNRWANVKKWSFTKCFCVYTRGDKGSRVRCWL